MQGFHADVYMGKQDFSRMFNTQLYEKVREEMGCGDAFPHAYEKVCLTARKLNIERNKE